MARNDFSTVLLFYYGMMIGATSIMPDVMKQELYKWELENIDGSGKLATEDWPGWIPIIGKCPEIAPRREKDKKKPIPQYLRIRVFERDHYRCLHCGSWKRLSVDHIIPESKGGPTRFDNLQTLCKSCNSIKGSS